MSDILYSENTLLKKPHSVIQFDKSTGELKRPTLLLRTKSGEYIGKLEYTNLKMSLVGKGLDELSFDVHKFVDGKKCPFWDKLTDLKTVEYVGYGCFETSVHINDAEKTVKSCVAVSLECELGQHIIREGHYNDDDDISSTRTVLYDDGENAEEHSLLHRVLKDKAPHWGIGFVSPLLNVNGYVYPPSKFQRIYTANGISIYDFLTGEVAAESNCVFLFDTYKRLIHCVNIEPCIYDPATMKVLEGVHKKDGFYYDKTGSLLDKQNLEECDGIGKDTNILVSKQKLAQDFGVEFNKDSVKNCFYVTGGDEVINNFVCAANMSGDNYIYQFSKFQYDDMSAELRQAMDDYAKKLEANREEFYGDSGIYTNYCNLVSRRSYLRDAKFPDTPTEETTAAKEYEKLKNAFSPDGIVVVVTHAISGQNYTTALKNAKTYMETIVDSRYNIAIKDDFLENGPAANEYILTGNVCITKDTDEDDSYTSTSPLKIKIQKINMTAAGQNANYIKQQLEFRSASMGIASLDLSASMSPDELYDFFCNFNLTSLEEYVSNFESCKNTLIDLANGDIQEKTENTSPGKKLYDMYTVYQDAAVKAMELRKAQVDKLDKEIENTLEEIKNFHEQMSLRNNITGDNLNEFWRYVREDEYNNGNYISDGLSDSKLIEKANELLEAATKELQKACVLQRSISVNLMNLFAIPEYRTLFDDFEIFNYIRVKVDDEIYKVRIVQLDFDENSPESIQVTFSENIECQDGTISDLQDMRSQIAGIATSYDSTIQQAKQGAAAQNTFLEMKKEGLLSSEFLIKNSNNEETVIDNSGILSRSMDDVGSYSDYQCKIIGKGLYLTSDNWKSVRAGIGLMKFNDAWQYGVIADTIVGNVLSGNEVIIENNAVTIDKNGIRLKGGSIEWETPIAQDNIEDLTTSLDNLSSGLQTNVSAFNAYKQEIKKFQDRIDSSLSALDDRIPLIPSTEIGQDYVISPEIGGGYLYIKGKNYSVEIDPNAQSNNTLHGYLFAIRQNDIFKTRIMSVDDEGNGYFKGQIETESGSIGGWNISKNSITTDDSSSSSSIMTGNISFTSKNNTGTMIGNGHILNGGPDGDNYKLAWIHNGAIDLYRQPYASSTYRTVITSDLLQGYNYKYADTPWFAIDNMERSLFVDGDIITTESIYINNGKYLESSSADGETINLIGTSSNSNTISIGNQNTQDTETICLNATNIRCTGDAPLATSSDERIKSNISPIPNPVKLIRNLEPCQYNLADSTSGRKHFGFIAQQVDTVLSQTTGDAGLFVKMPANDDTKVDFNNDTTYLCGLRYDEFIAPMVATIQDLYKQVDELKEEIKILKTKQEKKA